MQMGALEDPRDDIVTVRRPHARCDRPSCGNPGAAVPAKGAGGLRRGLAWRAEANDVGGLQRATLMTAEARAEVRAATAKSEWNIEPTADRDVRESAGARAAEPKCRSSPQPDGPPEGNRRIVHGGSKIGARDRDERLALERHRWADQRCLEARRSLV